MPLKSEIPNTSLTAIPRGTTPSLSSGARRDEAGAGGKPGDVGLEPDRACPRAEGERIEFCPEERMDERRRCDRSRNETESASEIA